MRTAKIRIKDSTPLSWGGRATIEVQCDFLEFREVLQALAGRPFFIDQELKQSMREMVQEKTEEQQKAVTALQEQVESLKKDLRFANSEAEKLRMELKNTIDHYTALHQVKLPFR